MADSIIDHLMNIPSDVQVSAHNGPEEQVIGNLEDLLKAKYGTVRYSGDFLYFPCPTCDPSDRHKVKRYVHKNGKHSKCWVCNVPLQIDELLSKEDFVSVAKTSVEPVVKPKNPMALKLPCVKTMPLTSLPMDHLALQFLRKDHLFDFETYTKVHGIVYCPSDGGMMLNGHPFTSSADRLIFPVTYQQQLVGWQMRSIPGTTYGDRADVLKYYHLFDKGNYLYNFDIAKTHSVVVVTEGVKKALKFPNGVATFGNRITEAQRKMLANYWPAIALMLDSDELTRKIASDLQLELDRLGKLCINVNLGDYNLKSPDEGTVEQLQWILYTEWKKINMSHLLYYE